MPGMIATRKSAGQRRIHATFWSSTTTVDSLLSQNPGNFEQFGQGWVAIDEVPFIVNASEHGVLYKVTTPYRTDIVQQFETLKKRVQVRGGGRTLNLLEIENAERRNREQVLHCAVA